MLYMSLSRHHNSSLPLLSLTRTKILPNFLMIALCIFLPLFFESTHQQGPSRPLIITPPTERLDEEIIQVNEGKVRGQSILVPGPQNQRISIFMGIPYAEPPIGKLRFKAPQPPSPWGGERPATQLPNTCVQYSPISRKIIGDEDCLYLNIYAPNTKANIDNRLPVMVYIHGGFFIMGSGNYNPAYQLSARHQIVVVTINYRLGVIGFLRHKDKSKACGNCGILDQIAALTWVQENIQNFGGDPEKITIFGQGSGGTSVKLLMTMPRARGIFDTVIAQSGSLASLAEDRDRMEIDTVNFLGQEAHCPTNNGKDLTDVYLECLRTLPTDRLMKAASKFYSVELQDFLHHPFQPYIEDLAGKKSEGNTFEEIMQNVQLNTEATLVTGINKHEGLIPYFPPLLPPDSYNQTDNGLMVNRQSFNAKIVPNVLHSQGFNINDAAMTQAAAFVYTNWDDPNNPKKIGKKSIEMAGDQLFTIPHLQDLAYFSKNHKKTYAYLYEYVSKTDNISELAKIPWFKNGTARGSEIPYIFGYPSTRRSFLEKTPHRTIIDQIPGFEKDVRSNVTDLAFSEFMMETWANIASKRPPFIRNNTGNWDRIKPNELNHLVISDMNANGPVLRNEKTFRAMEGYFWNIFYPKLRRIMEKEDRDDVKKLAHVPSSCTTYRRATWGIAGMLLVLTLVTLCIALARWMAKKRRRKFSSTPRANLNNY